VEVGFKLKWSLVPGGPEVGFLGYILEKFASGTSGFSTISVLGVLLIRLTPSD